MAFIGPSGTCGVRALRHGGCDETERRSRSPPRPHSRPAKRLAAGHRSSQRLRRGSTLSIWINYRLEHITIRNTGEPEQGRASVTCRLEVSIAAATPYKAPLQIRKGPVPLTENRAYLFDYKSRGAQIRTGDLLLPKQIPVFFASYSKQAACDHIEIKGVVGFAGFRVGTFGSVRIPTATILSTSGFSTTRKAGLRFAISRPAAWNRRQWAAKARFPARRVNH